MLEGNQRVHNPSTLPVASRGGLHGKWSPWTTPEKQTLPKFHPSPRTNFCIMEFATQTLCHLLFSRTFSTPRRSGPGLFRVYTACSSLCIRDQLCSELMLLFPPPLFITDPLQAPLAGAILARPCCRVLIQSVCHLFFSAVNELFLACRKDISSSIHWIMFEGKLNSIWTLSLPRDCCLHSGGATKAGIWVSLS